MANNCYNYITIDSDETSRIEEITNLLKPLKEDESIFKALIGLDTTDTEEVIKGTGQRWDVSLEDSNYTIVNDNCISFSFDTAWTPCLEFCKALSKKFGVFVKIEFDESGADFGGFATYNKGQEEEGEDYSFLEWEWRKGYLHDRLEEYADQDWDWDEDVKDRLDFLTPQQLEEVKQEYLSMVNN